ncbi:hypothetical protein [Agrobacterium genomosp. 13]|uniref:Uncharacterized protein n=1 Tax=Agrobacterium genomosp. 13 str. CFBP 6927 TaxID=1183428 RepID=A0ABP2BQD5_9HYPH|nr:hypothetical protein [Agrobacterium genomosp. 13]CUX66597.1 hypothetical protein AGR13a_Lc90455 [Agrobacterium genomosp. 13 str. CFBP 6927]
MNTNTLQTPSVEDHQSDVSWLDEYEKQIGDTDFSDFMVSFSQEDASDLGLRSRSVSIGYIDYLLDGHVAPQDEEASVRMIALMDEHAGPGWR